MGEVEMTGIECGPDDRTGDAGRDAGCRGASPAPAGVVGGLDAATVHDAAGRLTGDGALGAGRVVIGRAAAGR
jgi:hypothetical protein